MRRLAAASLVLLLMSGCSQVFDNNLFSSFDLPPPLDANTIKSMSPSSLVTLINNDSSFFDSLQGNKAALNAVHDVLQPVWQSPSASHSADQKTAVINAAQADIMATTFGTTAGAVVVAAIGQANDLTNGGSVATAISTLFAGKSSAEISDELGNLLYASGAFASMQVEATSGTSIDSGVFWGAGPNKGNLAQTALVAAAVNALVLDASGATVNDKIATLANQLASGGVPASNTPSMVILNTALNASSPSASSQYGYLTLAKKSIQ